MRQVSVIFIAGFWNARDSDRIPKIAQDFIYALVEFILMRFEAVSHILLPNDSDQATASGRR